MGVNSIKATIQQKYVGGKLSLKYSYERQVLPTIW